MEVHKNRYYIVDTTDILSPVLVRFYSWSRRWAKYNLKRYFNPNYHRVISGKVALKYELRIVHIGRVKFRIWITKYHYPASHNTSNQKRKTYRTIQRRKKKKLEETGRTTAISVQNYYSKA